MVGGLLELQPLIVRPLPLWLTNVGFSFISPTIHPHNIFILVVTIITEFPRSPQVLVVGADIIASTISTCTEAEKTSLKASLDEAALFLDEALNEAMALYKKATGLTLSDSELLMYTVPVTVTTTASRFRMREFQNKVLRH